MGCGGHGLGCPLAWLSIGCPDNGLGRPCSVLALLGWPLSGLAMGCARHVLGLAWSELVWPLAGVDMILA